jgi:aryl-phospho-beta-D-glucosidase BglC (GH1 family)
VTVPWRRSIIALACALALAATAACGHARPLADTARRGISDFEDSMVFAHTREDHALASVLESSARAGARGAIASGVVHRLGDHVVDGAGNPIALRGVNLGGAFLWEAWIWGGELSLAHLDDQSESHIRRALAELVSDGEVAAFARSVYDRMASDADFAAIAGHGFNVVRVPLNHRMLETADGLAALDRVLERAEAHGVYVVLDLHSAPGGQSKVFVADPEPARLWDTPAAQQRTIELWGMLAARYRERSVVAGYDLLNEPDAPNGAALVDMYRRIVRAIRAVDGQHMVVLEGDSAATDFSMFAGLLDANQIFSFHLYTWFHDNARERVASYAGTAAKLGAPMWCGEFGENTAEHIRAQVALFDATPSIAGWSFWTWKKTGNRYPALHEIQVSASWKATIDWLAHP